MPIRRLNYTKRKKLRRADFEITLINDAEGGPSFEAALRLGRYSFPETASVSIEAYHRTRLMRFDLGTVATIRPGHRYALTDFDSEDEILFRIKVTDRSAAPGKLLGNADRIQPHKPDADVDNRVALLPPYPVDLEHEIWRLELQPEPQLLINSNLPDWKETVKSNEFRALVYPSIVREVLTRILIIDRITDTEDAESWQSQWLGFVQSIPGVGDVPRSADDHEDWITSASAAFARRFRMRDRFIQEAFADEPRDAA